jgi:hypothetical protein
VVRHSELPTKLCFIISFQQFFIDSSVGETCYVFHTFCSYPYIRYLISWRVFCVRDAAIYGEVLKLSWDMHLILWQIYSAHNGAIYGELLKISVE